MQRRCARSLPGAQTSCRWPARTGSAMSRSRSHPRARERARSGVMRLFLAINLPSSVIGAIDHEVEALRAAAPGVRWIAPEKWHLTVRFIGEAPVERVAQIRDAIDAA